MIVKINVNDGWIFLDDVYNVEIRRNCKETEEHGQPVFITDMGSKFGADYVIRNIYTDPGGEKKDFKIVSCFRNRNEPITYVFNTVGYLMDDKGHTIESI